MSFIETLKERKLAKHIFMAMMLPTFIFAQGNFASAADVEIDPGNSLDSKNNRELQEKSESDFERTEGDKIVYGGGSETFEGSIESHKVTINSGTYKGVFGGMTSSGNAIGNIVTLNDGNIEGGIVGGFTFYYNNLSVGEVSGNKVYINGGTVNWVSGGEVGYAGSISDFSQLTGGNVHDNEVYISGGTINGGVIGGSALTGSAWGNKIIITGGTINGDVVAGEVVNPQSSSSVHNNTIEISGYPDLSGATFIGGWYGDSYSSSGNTLTINTAGITIGNIVSESFDRIMFNVPAYITSGSTIINLGSGNSSSWDLSKLNFSMDGKSKLGNGDTIKLVVNGVTSSADLASSADVGSTTLTVGKGTLWEYDADLTSDSDGITATIRNRHQSGNPVDEANDGDFINTIIPELDPFTEDTADTQMEDDEMSALTDIRLAGGYNIFLNSGGGKIKTKTGGGTYIKTSKGNFDIGLARTLVDQAEGSGKKGRLYIAPVFERATGHYNATLPVSDITGQHMHGNGSTKYTAGGMVMRRLNKSGVYYEGSFRGGRAENEFASNDFIISNVPTRVTYNMDAPIFTGHLRFGQAKKVSPTSLIDIYGIYFCTHQNGMGTELSTGEHVDFNSVTSQSTRIGYRLTTKTSKISRVYGGLAWQYDRNTDSVATAPDYRKEARGSRGSSGMIELGWQVRPDKNVPWFVDLSATGWAGRQQGFNALLKIQKFF